MEKKLTGKPIGPLSPLVPFSPYRNNCKLFCKSCDFSLNLIEFKLQKKIDSLKVNVKIVFN